MQPTYVTTLICGTVLIILFGGEPDIIDSAVHILRLFWN